MDTDSPVWDTRDTRDSPVMKVTISFNGTKIVVPCADGEISVREVTTLAATRYKKAIGKTNSYWVSVASLKSHEGGILDADDLIGNIYFFTKLFTFCYKYLQCAQKFV